MRLNKKADKKSEKFSKKETEVLLALCLFPNKYIPKELVEAYLNEQFKASRTKALITFLEGKNPTKRKSTIYLEIAKNIRSSVTIISIYEEKLYNALEEYKNILLQFVREVYNIIGEERQPQFPDEVEYHFKKAIQNPVIPLSPWDIFLMAEVIARISYFNGEKEKIPKKISWIKKSLQTRFGDQKIETAYLELLSAKYGTKDEKTRQNKVALKTSQNGLVNAMDNYFLVNRQVCIEEFNLGNVNEAEKLGERMVREWNSWEYAKKSRKMYGTLGKFILAELKYDSKDYLKSIKLCKEVIKELKDQIGKKVTRQTCLRNPLILFAMNKMRLEKEECLEELVKEFVKNLKYISELNVIEKQQYFYLSASLYCGSRCDEELWEKFYSMANIVNAKKLNKKIKILKRLCEETPKRNPEISHINIGG